MKLLLYCTKSRRLDRLCRENDLRVLSGRVVASCECNLVEEIFKDSYDSDWCSGEELRTQTYDTNSLVQYAYLDYEDLEKYLKVIYEEYGFYIKSYQKGYALHLENVKVFDKPKELRDYTHDGGIEIFGMKFKGIFQVEKASQNMMYVYDENGEKSVLISIHPEYLLKIISGEKTIEIRRAILNDLKKLIK